MKILLTQNTTEMGGVPMHTLALASFLMKLGHEVHIFTGAGDLVERYQAMGAKVVIAAPQADIDFGYIRCLAAYIKRSEIDVVLASMLKSVCNGLIAAKLAGCPCVTNMHGNLRDWEVPFYKKWPNVLIHALLVNLLAGRMIAISRSSGDMAVHQEFILKGKVTVIPNGINCDALVYQPARRLREGWNLPENALVIGYLGRLSEEKGVLDLLPAFRLVAASNPDAILVIGGSGELTGTLEDDCRRLGIIDRVRTIGQVAEGDRADFYSALDIVVFPSHRDGFGLTLVEGMACSRPVVANNLPVVREILDNGAYGELTNSRNSEQLAATIERLLNDAAKRARLGKLARQRAVSHYDEQQSFQRYVTLLESVVHHS